MSGGLASGGAPWDTYTMSTRLTPFAIEEFYHVYNRGNSKQTIFHDKDDMERFQTLLFLSNTEKRFETREVKGETTTRISKEVSDRDRDRDADDGAQKEDSKLIAIGAYCIMPNHFHILITPLTEKGVSKFMQKLTTAYSMYYNKKYARTGSLFEGKFKAKHINSDTHLKYLFSYIHLNPVKLIDPTWKEDGLKNTAKTLTFLETYTHSSYLDFLHHTIKTRDECTILSLQNFPEYFPSGDHFKKEIIAWFSYRHNL